jgi:predicted transcriptional regulator
MAKQIPISDELLEKFSCLTNELSPENLTCDGEATQSQITKRLASINKRWKLLEKEAGRIVTEDEVNAWVIRRVRNGTFKRIGR